MDKEQLRYLTEHIENVINKTVNGKIDNLDKKVDERFATHEEKMRPIYDVYTTANNVGKFIKWTAGILLAFAAIITTLKGWWMR